MSPITAAATYTGQTDDVALPSSVSLSAFICLPPLRSKRVLCGYSDAASDIRAVGQFVLQIAQADKFPVVLVLYRHVGLG